MRNVMQHPRICSAYTPYEGLNLANQMSRKLGVYSPEVRWKPFPTLCYFDKYLRK